MRHVTILLGLPLLALAPSAAAQDDAALAGWDDGFYLQAPDGSSRLEIGGRLQLQHATDIPDEGDTQARFLVRRARLKLQGHVFVPELTFKFQAGFGKGSVVLKDFFADYRFADGFRLRVGQWKRPFSRQQMTSSGKLILVDRAVTDDFFATGRDLGVAIHNGYGKSPTLEWAVGLFNGTGDKPWFDGSVDGDEVDGSFTNVPDAFEPALVARIGWNHGDLKGYAEGDLEGGSLRVGVAASALAGFDHDDGNDGRIQGEVDAILKLRGFAASTAFFVASAQDGEDWSDQDYSARGMHAQVSYVLGERWAPTLRYARICPDEDDANEQAVSGGLTVFLFGGHSVKWQTDATLFAREQPGGDLQDWRVRTQLQASF
ncbi:MAG: porin [Myxococcota bacterium]